MPPLRERREQRHRRLVLLALGALLVMSLSPVFGHHVIRAVDWLPASLEHVGPLCMVALHHLLVPVHEGFHYVLLIGILYAVVERGRAAWRMHQALGSLAVESGGSCPPQLRLPAQRAGMPLSRLHVVNGLPNPAFTVGWWSPQVYVAGDLNERLSADEIEAVLAHEMSHVRRRDPLRFFMLRAMASTLFWLPAIRRLVEDLADEAEVIADDAVGAARRLALASAILRLAGANMGSADSAEPVIGFYRTDLVERRIHRLAGDVPQVMTHVSRRSIVAASVALFAVWTSGVMVLHPLPEHGPAVGVTIHCQHESAWSLSHLWCPGERAASERCLH
jgi:hypothetical protein